MALRMACCAVGLTLGLSDAARAITAELAFPQVASTGDSATGGTYFFTQGDYVEQSFAGTGVYDLVRLDLSIVLESNILVSGGFVPLDIWLGETWLGRPIIFNGDGLGPFEHSFAVTDPAPLEDSYTLRYEVARSVVRRGGSISFSLTDSRVRLTGASGAPISSVPLPSGLPLLLLAFSALGCLHRRA